MCGSARCGRQHACHSRRERRRNAIEFQENIDERFNLGGVRREGDHDVVSISIATDVRRMAGFTEEEIERLIKTTQRSQVY